MKNIIYILILFTLSVQTVLADTGNNPIQLDTIIYDTNFTEWTNHYLHLNDTNNITNILLFVNLSNITGYVESELHLSIHDKQIDGPGNSRVFKAYICNHNLTQTSVNWSNKDNINCDSDPFFTNMLNDPGVCCDNEIGEYITINLGSYAMIDDDKMFTVKMTIVTDDNPAYIIFNSTNNTVNKPYLSWENSSSSPQPLEISSCTTFDDPYYNYKTVNLTQDVWSGQICMNMDFRHNLTLDCKGYEVRGTSVNWVISTHTSKNLHIKNCNISSDLGRDLIKGGGMSEGFYVTNAFLGEGGFDPINSGGATHSILRDIYTEDFHDNFVDGLILINTSEWIVAREDYIKYSYFIPKVQTSSFLPIKNARVSVTNSSGNVIDAKYTTTDGTTDRFIIENNGDTYYVNVTHAFYQKNNSFSFVSNIKTDDDPGNHIPPDTNITLTGKKKILTYKYLINGETFTTKYYSLKYTNITKEVHNDYYWT